MFNLLSIFKSEHERSKPPTRNADQVSNQKASRQAAAWKFAILDKNNDTQLKKREFRDFKRMVKKIVHPRSCAKMFAKLLDVNKDAIISRHEWMSFFKTLSARKIIRLCSACALQSDLLI